MSSVSSPPVKTTSDRRSSLLFRWSKILLTTTVWSSTFLFGLYILAFYAAAMYQGNMQRWNELLPRIYERQTPTATTGIGLHFAMGGIILVLGCIQLIDQVRLRFPGVHRWLGRIYVVSSLLAALGGLVFIAMKGTIGGLVMNIGFGLYGILMFWAAIETYRQAVAGRMEQHRVWALRLFALAIGSWLYRMDYGFWYIFFGKLGHTSQFNGPFDYFMAFFFYLPNLLLVEILVRKRAFQASPRLKIAASGVLIFATVFLMVGTYFFTSYYWGPAILGWFFG